MNTRKVMKEALKDCDRAKVAKAMGMHLGSLNNQVAGELPYQPKGNTLNFIERFMAFVELTNDATGKMILLEAIAEEFGYMLIANPIVHACKSPAITKVAEILHDFSSVVDEIGKATADGRIELHEAEKIRERWEILKRLLEEFVLACETGTYDSKSV